MAYFSTDKGAQIHDIAEDYYLYPDQSLSSALVVGKQDELTTMVPEPPTLENEWEATFHTVQYLVKLRERALSGKLKSSSFRSVAWQIFLGVLPGDIRRWIEVAKSNRDRYDGLKTRYVVDPHQTEDMSLTVNNPLSQEEKSPWAQFFLDNELRRVIQQDIERTYPGELMFEQPEIQGIMLNILFIFAREKPEVDYKQGMHELLAPLVHVFYNEYTVVKDVARSNSQLIRTLVDIDYVEHDLYWTYLALMRFTVQYYTTDKVKKPPVDVPSSGNTQLFKRVSIQPSTFIVQRLNELQNLTLRKFDPELQQHLQKLAIPPQLYGLRWMRLLFGREFPLSEVLTIWDALLASPDFSSMVEYMCVSMLLYIRDALLCNDHTGCLTLLMKYPETSDPQFFVQRALYLRNPSRYSCPPNLQYKANKTRLANGSVSGRRNSSGSVNRASSLDRTRLGSANQQPATRHDSSSSNVSKASPVTVISETIKRKMSLSKQSESDKNADEIEEYKRITSYCSNRLDSLLDELQTTICEICEESNPHEDNLMVSLAGLKQVRDILKGNVTLGCILGPDSETASFATSENGDVGPTASSITEEDDAGDDASTSSGAVPPAPPPADLETLDLFRNFSQTSRTLRRETLPSKKQDESEKKDFTDPLSSLLSDDTEEQDLHDFLSQT